MQVLRFVNITHHVQVSCAHNTTIYTCLTIEEYTICSAYIICTSFGQKLFYYSHKAVRLTSHITPLIYSFMAFSQQDTHCHGTRSVYIYIHICGGGQCQPQRCQYFTGLLRHSSR